MSESSNYFSPARCDECGNTNYPYVIKGRVVRDGMSIKVDQPVDFAEKWPTVSTEYFSFSDDRNPRQLTPTEVQSTANRKPSVRAELRSDKLGKSDQPSR